MRRWMVVFLWAVTLSAGAAPVRSQAFRTPSAMELLRPGEVKPRGWLLDRCRAAKAGYISRMDEVDKAFPRAWNSDFHPRGKYLDWTDADKGAWCTEGGAYWFEGLVRLAWELDDPDLKALATKRLTPLLERMNPNALGFVYWMDRRDPAQLDELEKANHGFIIGASGRTTRSLIAYYEATGDERALQALKWCLDDPRCYFFGNPVTLPAAGCDTWRYCGDERLAAALENFKAKYPEMSAAKWPALRYGHAVEPETIRFQARNDRDRNANWEWRLQHGVLAYESMYSFLKLAQWSGDRRLLGDVIGWADWLEKNTLQVHGVTVADEQYGGPGEDRGTETCTVAGDLLLNATLAGVTGEGRFGDHVERAFFNAGAACVSRDWMHHVYFQAPNRTSAVGRFFAGPGGKGGVYKRKHWPLCCTAALARILPGYVQWMWMRPADGGIAAVLYGPNALETEIAGAAVRIETETAYPFDETVALTVRPEKEIAFPLKLRIPAWCGKPEVAVNGKVLGGADAPPVRNGFVSLDRTWRAGDRVTLRFPMKPTVTTARDVNQGGKRTCSISMGPLLFAYAIPSKDENTPLPDAWTGWSLDSKRVLENAEVTHSPMPEEWRWQEDAPVKVSVKASTGERLTLVPYGCARLRVSMFPDSDVLDLPVTAVRSAADGAAACDEPTGAGDFTVELPRATGGATVKAADFGFSPTNDANQEAITRAAEECRRIGAARLELAPGTYRCRGRKGVVLRDLKDLTVDGRGATLVFWRPAKGGSPNVVVRRCERVELKDFTMDWDWATDPLGDLVEVIGRHVGEKEDNSSYFDVRFPGIDRHPTYPNPMAVSDFNPMTVAPDGKIAFRDTNLNCKGNDILADLNTGSLGAKSEWLSPNTLRVWPNVRATPGEHSTWDEFFKPAKNRRCVDENVQVGNVYRLLHYYYGEGGFNMDSNAHLTLRDITVWSCRGHGFCVSGSQHHWQLLNVKLEPPQVTTASQVATVPSPSCPASQSRRVVTATSDGTHVVQSNGYCLYDGCVFRLTNDDTWNFHDVTSPVRRRDARTLACVSPYGTSRVKAAPGDVIELAETDFTPIAWRGRIVSVAKDAFTVDTDVPEGDAIRLLFDRAHATTHVKIRNCTVEDSHFRGLLYTHDTTVENCTFRRTGGHSLSFEVYYNLERSAEGSGVTNVVVRGCTFEESERRLNYSDSATIRSIAVVNPSKLAPKVLNRGTFGRFLIENCRFVNPRGMCLKMNAVRDLVFRNNDIELRSYRGNQRYTQGWLGFENSENVRIEGNRWHVSPSVTNAPGIRLVGDCPRFGQTGNVVAGPVEAD